MPYCKFAYSVVICCCLEVAFQTATQNQLITNIKLSERGMIRSEKHRYRQKEYPADRQLLPALN